MYAIRYMPKRVISLLGALDAARLLDELKSRLHPWIDLDPEGILADAGDGRQRRRAEVAASIEAIRAALQVT